MWKFLSWETDSFDRNYLPFCFRKMSSLPDLIVFFPFSPLLSPSGNFLQFFLDEFSNCHTFCSTCQCFPFEKIKILNINFLTWPHFHFDWFLICSTQFLCYAKSNFYTSEVNFTFFLIWEWSWDCCFLNSCFSVSFQLNTHNSWLAADSYMRDTGNWWMLCENG